MKHIHRPPTQINFLTIASGSNSAVIDVLGPRRLPLTVVIGVLEGQAGVVFGTANIALSHVMPIESTAQFTVDPPTRYMIVDNVASAGGTCSLSWYVY